MNHLWPENLSTFNAAQLHTLQQQLLPGFQQLLDREKIPHESGIISNFAGLYLPLAAWLAGQHNDQTVIIGINGAQGSGKSTLTNILAELLETGFNKKVTTLSIDDLYKTRRQRQHMAQNIHPLFGTRGVPGTHNIDMGLQLFKDLKQAQLNDDIYIPQFNKVTDDQHKKSDWKKISMPVDIILFEGWCVGALPEHDDTLTLPINALEEKEDPHCIWREYVNQQLAGPYHELFSQIDLLIMLAIPDMKHIFDWRQLQERKLKQTLSGTDSKHDQQLDDNDQLQRFIMHFERITRACLNEMPQRADIVLKLDNQHQVSRVTSRTGQ